MSRWPTSSDPQATRPGCKPAAAGGGRLIVLSGPAGAGKTTVAARVCEELGLRRSVSATTRPPRAGEVDGRDYLFLAEEDFRRRVGRGEFLEHARVHGHLYGTPRGPVERAMRVGEDCLLVIDVEGAMQVREQCPGALFIFLDAPDERALRDRLARRSSESPDEMEARLTTAQRERQHKERYDYCVTNDDLDRAAGELCRIISADSRLKDRRHSVHGRGSD